jgi:archaeosine synthase beta-subunit
MSGGGENFLNQVARRLRRNRPRFIPPAVWFRRCGNTLADIWFPSGGCTWDSQGKCTMCNFGQPTRVEPKKMVEAVRLAIDALSVDMPQTLCVTAFNVLDEREVPASTRREIFSLLGKSQAKQIIIETHINSIRESVVSDCVEILDGRLFGLEIGIESMSDFIRRCCINKNISSAKIREVIETCHKYGATVHGNFLLGAPFLSPTESIEDASLSIIAADEMGMDEFVLFPIHVKPYTVVDCLYQNNLYKPPSLWQIVDVLYKLDSSLRGSVYYAWVTPKEHPGAQKNVVPAVNDAEPELVIEKLLSYAEDHNPSTLEWLVDRNQRSLDARGHFQEKQMELPERIIQGYEVVGRSVLSDVWWKDHGAEVVEWVWNQWKAHREQ